MTSAVAFGLLGLDVAGSTAVVVALAVGNALLGMSLGLFVSAFARTEFQAVQFMPAIVFPQLLLCGLFVARDQMVGVLQVVSDTMPLTYAFEALDRVTTTGSLGVARRPRRRRDRRRHAGCCSRSAPRPCAAAPPETAR